MPEHRADGVGIVVDRHRDGVVLPVSHLAADLVRVVEVVIAHAQIDVESAAAAFAAAVDLSILAGDRHAVVFDDFVTHVVGRDGLRFQFLLGAGEFRLHGLDGCAGRSLQKS